MQVSHGFRSVTCRCELAALDASELIGLYIAFVCLKRNAFKCDLFRNDGFFCAAFLHGNCCVVVRQFLGNSICSVLNDDGSTPDIDEK